MKYLITGGAGYFGSVLKRKLLEHGHECVSIDLLPDVDPHPLLTSYVLDVTHRDDLEKIFQKHGPFDAVYHSAAQLQLKRNTLEYFDKTNIDSTGYLAELSVKYGVKNFIFISSNCVYGLINSTLVKEDHPRNAFERYGKSKVASEKILEKYFNQLNVIILRPPTIVGMGRLGILSIVYDFIREHRKVWLVGNGNNRYQFILGEDLAEACRLAATVNHSGIYNIGCDQVPSLNELFADLIAHAKSRSKILHLPQTLAMSVLKIAYHLGISPLGPYNYSMISSSYIGDTQKIKAELNWQPTKSNSQMLIDGYEYYVKNFERIHDKTNQLPGHRKAGWGGVITLLKWFS